MNAVSRDPLPFNPAVLRWARKRAGLDREEVAGRLAITADRLAVWESPGADQQPTVKQARKLANVYGRPFLEFFSQSIPNVPEVEIAPDYRFHREPPSSVETRVLEGIHAWAEEQRLNLIDLYAMLGEEPPEFPASLHAVVDSDVDDAAARAREATAFPIEQQMMLKKDEKLSYSPILGQISS